MLAELGIEDENLEIAKRLMRYKTNISSRKTLSKR